MIEWEPSRWTLKILLWAPQRARCVGRPQRRLEDSIGEFESKRFECEVGDAVRAGSADLIFIEEVFAHHCS